MLVNQRHFGNSWFTDQQMRQRQDRFHVFTDLKSYKHVATIKIRKTVACMHLISWDKYQPPLNITLF